MMKSFTTKAMFAAGAATVAMTAMSAPAEAIHIYNFSVSGPGEDIEGTLEFAELGNNLLPVLGSNSVVTSIDGAPASELPLQFQSFTSAISGGGFNVTSTGLTIVGAIEAQLPQFSSISSSQLFFNENTAFGPQIVNGTIQTATSGEFEVAGTFSAEKIPTPALLPGLIGMGVAALRKRKGEAEEVEA